MDWKRLDRARREVGPVHLDLIEHYAQGKISRRNFIRRGTIIGLSMPLIGAVISACGGDDDDDSERAARGTATARRRARHVGGARHDRCRPGRRHRSASPTRRPAGPLDPINMQDLGTYGLIAQCFEFLVTLGDDGELAPGLAESWEPNEDGTVWTFQLRQGVKWQDGGDFTSADVAATMDRLVVAENAGLHGVIAEGAVDATDPNVAVFNLEGPNGNFPYLVSVFNAQTPITPVSYETGTTLDGDTERHRAVEARHVRPGHRRDVRAQPGLVGRPDAARRPGDARSSASSARWSRRSRAVPPTPSSSSPCSAATPCSTTRTSRSSRSSPRRTARSGWAATTGQFVEKAARQALAFTFDREQMISTLFQGRAVIGNDHVIAPFMPFFNEGAVEQRTKDVERARSLLAEAGARGRSPGGAARRRPAGDPRSWPS